MHKTLLPLLCSFFLALSLVSPAAAQVLYGSTGSNGVAGNLYTIDPTNGAATLVGPIVNSAGGGPMGITGLAFSPVNGLLYGITTNFGGFPRRLVTINPFTAVATIIGSLGFANSDISFAADGTLYGYEAGSGATQRFLTTIDIVSGVATRMPTSSGLSTTMGGGLAFGPMGTLYLSATGSAGTLDTVDDATGARLVGNFLSGSLSGGTLNSMAVDANGTLFAADSDQATTATVRLVMIDPTTGVITNLGLLPDNIDGLAFFAVPEPSIVCLGVLGLGLLIAGLCFRRVRRV